MTILSSQFELPTLSDRVMRRLESLGLTVASVAADGWVTVQGPSRWIERLITDSPQFAATVRRNLSALEHPSGETVEIWPGVRLISLATPRRRRSGSIAGGCPILVVLLVGPEMLESEWFDLLCDTQQVDKQAALARIESDAMVGIGEVNRLATILSWMQQDSAEISRGESELRMMTQQLASSYEELSLLYKLSANMTVNESPKHFLTQACRELQQVVGLRWIALQLTDDRSLPEELAGRTIVAGPVGCDQGTLKRTCRVLMEQRREGSQPLVVDDTQALGIPHISRLAKKMLVVSLMWDDRTVGVLIGGDKLDGSHISSVDSKLCSCLGGTLSIFLRNTMLYEDVQAMFMGTLHGLTSAIDAKDSYTHGHSERVALLARLLATKAGLDDHLARRVYLAGLVHDLGKIGVPEAVLAKAGHLTDEELGLIKQHPEIGARIIADIRPMHDLVPGVLYHHEAWDGGGYPYGLVGEQIPLFGRLLSLADSFDAMSSNRAYRKAMSLDQILDEIKRCAGTQFDPQLAGVFLKLDFGEYFQMIQEHQ